MTCYSDLHCDTATYLYDLQTTPEQSDGHLCAKTFEKFHRILQVFAVFVDDTYNRDFFPYYRAVRHYTDPFWDKYPQLTPIFSVEGGGAILQNDLTRLEQFQQDNVRIFGIVWNGENSLATGAVRNQNAGLTNLGKTVCKQLHKCGMYPDVSHLSDRGFADLARLTDGPILATHSNARACCDHPRNLTDAQAKEIITRGGLIGLNLCPDFIGGKRRIEDLLNHAEHFLSMGGEQTLALGCDFDGISATPPGIRDASDISFLYQRAEERFGKHCAENLIFRNVANFFHLT